MGSRDVLHKIWAWSVQPFWRLLDTNKQTNEQTDRQAKFIYRWLIYKKRYISCHLYNLCFPVSSLKLNNFKVWSVMYYDTHDSNDSHLSSALNPLSIICKPWSLIYQSLILCIFHPANLTKYRIISENQIYPRNIYNGKLQRFTAVFKFLCDNLRTWVLMFIFLENMSTNVYIPREHEY